MSKCGYIVWLLGLVVLVPISGISNSEAPLPKVEEIVERAIARGKIEDENDQKFKQQYYFVRSRKTEIRNANGDIKKSKVRISTNAPVVVVAPVQPQKLPVAVPVIGATASAPPDSKSDLPIEMPRKFDKKQLEFSQDLAKRFDFKLVGREQTNGVTLLVVDFAPKKTKLPEKGIVDRIVNRMAGRVWVDEREYAIQKCAVNLTESISIVGGIVGEAKKFNYGFERERTEDGLWYVRESSWHLEGREVVVHREADYHEQRTEVRKREPEH